MANVALLTSRRQWVPRQAEQGFTLVEMLVVITLIALVMGLVGPRVLNYLTESKVKTAKIQIESFESALDLYFLDAGRYPTTSEGLGALIPLRHFAPAIERPPARQEQAEEDRCPKPGAAVKWLAGWRIVPGHR